MKSTAANIKRSPPESNLESNFLLWSIEFS